MHIKTFLLALLAIVFCSYLHAQDKIYKRNGEIIDANIKSVGTRTISYTRLDNPTGPEYTIAKTEVDKIKYKNGSEDEFELPHHGPHRYSRHSASTTKTAEKEDKKIKYGYNVLALSPMQFSENGLGFSISYERALDHNGIIAFSMPVIATFNLNNSSYYDNATQTYRNGHNDAMYYALPGVKIYPTGSFGRVRYAVGPSLVIAAGEKSSSNYDQVTGALNYQTKSHSILGMMMNNSLNINPGAHIYLGFEFGLGFSYLNRVDGLNQDTNVLVQGSFKIGYRF